ncbi:MAG: helicase-exonuclease AddAB subunit AddB [Caulobacteraceae bacterium]
MGLRLIYGRAGSGKSSFYLNEIKAGLKAGDKSRHIIIVPEQFSFQAEKRLIKSLGSSGINGVEVLSFGRLAFRVFGEVGGLVRRHINPAGKSMLVYSIMSSLKEQLRVFSKAAGQKGFVTTLCSTISELKRYNVTPEALKRLNIENEGGPLQDKLHDIGLIYGEFEKRLHDRYTDSDDDLTFLAERLDSCSFFDGTHIWVDEFSGFTPQEYTVLGKLMQKAASLNVTLCTDCLADECILEEADAFLPAKNACAKLKKLAGENNVKVLPPVALDSTKPKKYNKELAFLEANLYTYIHGIYKDSTENIVLHEAPNIFAEVESAARDILRQCRDEGLRYRDIAVITGDLALYEKIIRVVFKEYGIPCFIDRKKDINGHPIVLLVISALQIFISNWSYESVFRYLKTGLTGMGKDDSDLLENYVLANGIRGNGWLKDEDWNYRLEYSLDNGEVSQYEKEYISRVNEIRRRVSEPLLKLYQRIRKKVSGKEMCSALFDFLCELGVPDRLEALVGHFREEGELEHADEYGQVWNMLLELLDQVIETVGDELIKPETFLEILSVGFGECKIGLIPPALEQVQVGSVERSKSHDIKAIYILGANDGIFPAPFKQEGILSDRDREIIRSEGLELAPDTRGRTFEQQYLVYTALTAPSEYLRLSFCASDNEGRALRPSMVVYRLKRIFHNIKFVSGMTNMGTPEESAELVSAPAPTFNELVSVIRHRFEGKAADPVWRDVLGWYSRDGEWKEKYLRVIKGFSYTNQVGMIEREKVRKLYGGTIHASISRLEKYVACPFSYYVQYGLKAKERRVLKLNAPDTGTFIHKVIDMFSKSVSEGNISWRQLDREWCSEKVSSIVDELVAGMSGNVFSSSDRYKYLAGRLKRVLTRAVWLIVEHIKKSSFEPLGYEIGFGMGEKLPPITVEMPSGEMMILSGRIDRLDCFDTDDGTYFRIIDYKSGSKQFKLSDVYYGLQIQLITYLDAVSEKLKPDSKKPVLPAGILYFKVDDPIVMGGRGVSEEEIEKTIMKELKMKGLLIADVRLIKEMDNSISGDSMIIPARINKDDTLGRSSAATMEQFGLIRKHVRNLLQKLGEEMLRGNISISPYKRKRITACTYCSYLPVCQFDTSINGNKFRNLYDKKDDEIWGLLGEAKAVEGGEEDGSDKENE